MDNDRTVIEEVKSRSDIVAVVDRYVKLKQAGKNFSGLCPFHNEKTPSFSVNPDFQIFKCFGCGKSGDVIAFVQEIETLDFTQALEKLAKEAGIEIKQIKGDINLNDVLEVKGKVIVIGGGVEDVCCEKRYDFISEAGGKPIIDLALTVKK